MPMETLATRRSCHREEVVILVRFVKQHIIFVSAINHEALVIIASNLELDASVIGNPQPTLKFVGSSLSCWMFIILDILPVDTIRYY
jgi:hypothetical protein